MSETPYRIEPCSFEETPAELSELAAGIRTASSALGAELPEPVQKALARTINIADARFSHLIEGIDLAPEGIAASCGAIGASGATFELQLAGAYARERSKLAGASTTEIRPTSRAWILRTHRELLELLSEPKIGTPWQRGQFRRTPEEDVAVGRHVPPSSDRVEDFMAYFERRFAARPAASPSAPIDVAIAHHRFCYVHPLPDLNGRLGRLMSAAMITEAKLDANGLWSISRALAGRNRGATYLKTMEMADEPRRGDLDGRGNLSTRALKSLCIWFLQAMFSEIGDMSALLQPKAMEGRYVGAANDACGPAATRLAELAFRKGRISLEDAGDDHGSITALRRHGLVADARDGQGFEIRMPIKLHGSLLPGLFD